MKHGIYAILVNCDYSFCARCGRVLPTSAFRKDHSRRHGLSYYCGQCMDAFRTGTVPEQTAIERPRRRKVVTTGTDLQRILEASDLAYCAMGHIEQRSRFDRDSRACHGLHSYCKAHRDSNASRRVPAGERVGRGLVEEEGSDA